MLECEQTKGVSVLEHGLIVNKYFHDLLNHLQTNSPLKYSWRLPDWVKNPELLQKLLPLEIMNEYQIYHDCGKPFCRTVDSGGKVHFPNHAEVSFQIAKEHGFPEQVCSLIRADMDAHLLKSDGVEAFAARPEATSLLFTALAELHANATMFGGLDSVGFKIKFKNLEKQGRKVVDILLKNQ